MKIIRYIAILIWRIWFYVWVTLTITVAFIPLLIVTSRKQWYPAFYKIAHVWGKTILFVMGFKAKIEIDQEIDPYKSYMFCANHTSMIDIMLMLAVVKNPCVFVGKAELGKIPIFGFFFKRTSIMVDRSSSESRKSVFAEAQRRLDSGLSVCIFPEGLVPSDESVVLAPFKNGAFILAIEHQIPMVPMTFYDCKKRFSYTFFSGSPGDLRVKIHSFIETKGLELKDKSKLNKLMFDTIYNELANDLNSQ
ncbi:lysophospholipid acyltransferase family protein [Urechidicola croceus]|uniref:1-acyl-sn-glycerol-3-phosphate acyltransferase n=1 Tax=Urechidicola croceus TaxID=1850246 RepID=A0A1D8P9A3_9FLAO|nr:lysophospholipid acyltransferase family protein [Urechidicola croceus]AOW21129.1 1-acyl-sn-glycerol-3-phosphate acyltransferase [Urechidicola croceus]